jgi:hypothetical protein
MRNATLHPEVIARTGLRLARFAPLLLELRKSLTLSTTIGYLFVICHLWGRSLLPVCGRFASSAIHLSGPVPARNADPDLLKYKNKSRSQSR